MGARACSQLQTAGLRRRGTPGNGKVALIIADVSKRIRKFAVPEKPVRLQDAHRPAGGAAKGRPAAGEYIFVKAVEVADAVQGQLFFPERSAAAGYPEAMERQELRR